MLLSMSLLLSLLPPPLTLFCRELGLLELLSLANMSSSSRAGSANTGMSTLTSLENDLRSPLSTELLPSVSADPALASSSPCMSTLYLPRAVSGLGTGLDTVLPAVLARSISTSLAELGGREVKGLSVTVAPGLEESSAWSVDSRSDMRPVLGPSAVDLRPR